MIGKIYSKNLTFLQDQPFAEDILPGISYKKKNKPATEGRSTNRDSSLSSPLFLSDLRAILGTQAAFAAPKAVQGSMFGTNRIRNKSERMKKAEISLVKHFCLLLERTNGISTNVFDKNLYNFNKPPLQPINQNRGTNKPLFDSGLNVSTENVSVFGFKVGDVIPHLLVSVDSMRNTLLGTRGSRSPERVKTPSQFKKTLRESRKVRLLYGNLSRRHLCRATNKLHLPGENLLLWLESRLDVVLERCGFFTSVKAARQAVLNGQIMVNSKITRSPGFLLKGGDFIKITQERLFLESLNKQLRRDVILSNKVFSRLITPKSRSMPNFNVSKSLFEGTISKALPDFNTALQERIPYTASPCASNLCDNKAPHRHQQKVGEKGFDSFSFPVYGSLSYSSFYAWLVKKQKSMGQESEFLGYPRKPLFSTNIWRFLGSPHLLFSYSFFHTLLKEVMLSVAETANKNVIVEKRADNLNPYSTQQRQHARLLSKAIQRFSHYYSIACFRASSPFSSISSAWNFCAVNTLATSSVSKKKLVLRFCTDHLDNNELLESSKIESLLKVLCQFFQKNKSVTAVHHALFYGVDSPHIKEEGVATRYTSSTDLWSEMSGSISANVEIYNTLFSCLSPLCFNKDVFLTRDKDHSLRVASIVERNDRDSLSVRLSDLLLYSLLIKKEILYGQLKKQQLSTSGLSFSDVLGGKTTSCREGVVNKANPHVKEMYSGIDQGTKSIGTNQPWVGGSTGPGLISGRGRQKAFDSQVGANRWLLLNSSRTLAESRAPGRSSSLKVGAKKRHVSEVFGRDQARRVKPLHLEISHRTLCAVFLYPPQRICLPVMIDVECLLKSL